MPIPKRLQLAEADHSRERLSDLLHRLATQGDSEWITFRELTKAVGDRAFGALILVFTFPNIIAGAVPGVSTLLGVPLMLLSVQLMIGAERAWLPRKVRARGAKRADFARVVAVIQPWLKRFEKLLKPRLVLLTSTWAERCIGLVCLLAAGILFLPIPFANLLPALTLFLFGLALLERDGVLVLLGLGMFALSLIMLGGALLTVKALVLKALPALLNLF